MDIFNFAFVKTIDITALTDAIILINRSRHNPIHYTRIIQTTPRDGWIALISNSVTPDHYLLRNISGRLHVRTFELGLNNIALYYRIHEGGRTVGAFESHLGLWVAQQLRTVLNTGDVKRIDLAEPAGRLVLQRYHEHQRSWAWAQPNTSQKIPPPIEDFYKGRIDHLKPMLSPGIDANYVSEAIRPGFAAPEALNRLVEALELPYIKGEPVVVGAEDRMPQPIEDKMVAMDTHELGLALRGQRVLQGMEVLQATTWPENQPLPKGWVNLEQEQWKSEG